jgi:hypothetical protein
MTHAVNAALTSGNANEIEALKNDLHAANNLHGSDICEDEVRTAATGRFSKSEGQKRGPHSFSKSCDGATAA